MMMRGTMNVKIPDEGLVKPKNVRAFIVYFNVNFNILKQIGCALVGLKEEWILYWYYAFLCVDVSLRMEIYH
jgi:hypothetical protein